MNASEANPKEKYLFEKASYLKAIFTLALPSILGQLILVLYNMADTFFVGLASNTPYFVNNNLTNSLVAGITICMPIYMIISAISNLFGIGAASVMSRSMGKQNYEKARNASRFAFWCCLVTSLIYSLFILIFSNPISLLMSGGDKEIAQFAQTYLFYCVGIFGVPTALNTLLSHLFRGETKSLHASIGIAIGGILNVILDPIFIFCLPIEKAAFSVALATGLSNVIALIYYFVIYLKLKKDLVISFKFKKKMFNESVPLECVLIGLPACLMTLFENISYAILDSLMSKVSIDAVINKAALAGIGTAKKINMFAHSTVRGMTQGVLPLIGYNKASGKRHRMRYFVYISGGISLAISLICLTLNFTLSKQLTEIFIHEKESIKYGASFLKILTIGAPFSALAYTVISFFQAVGRPWRSLIVALLRKGLVDIPLMFILKDYIEIFGIVLATPIADIICSIVAIILFAVYIKYHGHDRKDTNEEIPAIL